MKTILISRGNPVAFILKLILVATLFLFIQCKSEVKEIPQKTEISQSTITILQSYLDELVEAYPIPGLSIGIVAQDSVYYTTKGFKNSNKEALTINTPVLSGSLSEPVLAHAILKLSKDGMLNLDDKVVKYLPYFTMGGSSYNKITIRHLLTHTSGIDHYSMMWDLPNFDANAPEITTRSIATQQPKWDVPGTHVVRSPYNYDILADLISKVTKKPFEDYVRDEIFYPLGMNDTRFYKIKNSAMPFEITDWLKFTFKQANSYPYNRENGGSGGLHTSAKDITFWMYYVLHQFETKDNHPYFQSHFITGNESAVGLGWEIRNKDKKVMFSKGSQYGGFSQQIIMIPSGKIGIAVFSNISADFNSSNIANNIANFLVNNEKLDLQLPISLAMTKKFATTGNINDAFKLYEDLIKLEPQKYDFSVQALQQFGINLLHRVNDNKNAIKALEFCVNKYPESSSANLYLAEAYVSNKDVIKTKQAINRSLTLKADGGNRENFIAFLNEKIEIIEEKQQL